MVFCRNSVEAILPSKSWGFLEQPLGGWLWHRGEGGDGLTDGGLTCAWNAGEGEAGGGEEWTAWLGRLAAWRIMWVAVPAYTRTHNSAAGHLLTYPRKPHFSSPTRPQSQLPARHRACNIPASPDSRMGTLRKRVPGPDELSCPRTKMRRGPEKARRSHLNDMFYPSEKSEPVKLEAGDVFLNWLLKINSRSEV